ncbi:MAG: HEAT repeat domain-containing protein, partial [bacterium]|nr:HEAT repeat domain-containing protein [bacterium]
MSIKPKFKISRIVKVLMVIMAVAYLVTTDVFESINITGLIDKLDTRNESKRFQAFQKLLEIGEPAVEPLVYAIKNKNWPTAAAAESVLCHIGKPAVKPLMELLKSTDTEVLIRAVTALGKIKTPETVEPLISLLKARHQNPVLTRKIIWALAEIKDSRAVSPLITLLNSKKEEFDTQTAIVLIRSLESFEDKRRIKPLLEGLKHQDCQIRLASAAILGRTKDSDAVEPLIETLNDKNWRVRHRVVLALGMVKDERALDKLEELYYKGDPIFKKLVVYVLGEIGHPKSIEFLSRSLYHKDEDIQKIAALSLVKIGEPAVGVISKVLTDQSKKNYSTRRNIVDFLGETLMEWACPPLRITLKDNSLYLRECTVRSLFRIGKPAVKLLTEVVRDSSNPDRIRIEAIKSLREIKDERAVESLLEALENESVSIRKEAAEALKPFSKILSCIQLKGALKSKYKFLRISIVGLFYGRKD